MTKAVLYARVSSKDQEKEGFSIPAQQELLKDYAKKYDIQITKEFIDVETAKKAGRTNFNEMIAYLKEHKDINTILVEKTDRLYRNFKDYVMIEDKYEIHLVKEGVILSDNSRSHEKLMHGFKVLIAKNYIDNLREETVKGMAEKAKQGYFPHRAPFGYKNVVGESGKKIIVVNPETAPMIVRAFELYSKGTLSLQATSEQLYKEGFCYRPYAPKLGISALEDMLKNPFYKGLFLYKGDLMKGKHEPLISKQLFDDVQRAFKKDNKSHYSKNKFLLANFMTCPDCGCSIIGEIKKKKYIYYHCSWGKGKANCNNKKYHNETDLIKQFDEIVKQIEITEEAYEAILDTVHELNKYEQQEKEDRLEDLNRQANEIRKQIQAMYNDKLSGIVTYEFWQEQNNTRQEMLNEIMVNISALDKTSSKYMQDIIDILELAKDAYSNFIQLSDEGKLIFVKSLLSNCYMKDGKLSWEYNTAFSILAKYAENKKILPRLDSNQQPTG